MTKLDKLDKLEKKLSDKRKTIAQAIADNKSNEELLSLTKELYKLDDNEIAQNILNFVSNIPEVKEFSWSKKKIQDIEEEMANIALTAEKEADRIKAGAFIHDKVKGKAKQPIDHTTDGEKITITGINYIKPDGDNNKTN